MLGSPRARAAGLLVALVATSGAAVSLAAPAQAAPAGRIVAQNTVGERVEVVFSATGLPADAVIDPASVKILIDGKTQPTTVRSPAGAQTAGRTAVLAIDTSGSMAGGGLDGAKSAADQFLSTVPADVKVGLVTFSDDAKVVVPPTTDRAAVSKAVAGLKPSGDTALYDATVLAARTAGTTGSRTVLMLTDGQDDGSSTSLSDAAAAVKSSGVVLDGVSLGTGAGQVDALTTLAKSGRGFVITTDQAGQLAAVFAGEAQSISKQVLASAAIPAGVAGTNGNLTVNATAAGTALTDSVFVAFGSPSPVSSAVSEAEQYGPQPVTPQGSGVSSTAVLVFAVIAVFVGLAVLLSVALVGLSDRDPTTSRMRRRMSIYTLTGRQAVKEEETTTVLGTSGVARSAVEFAGRMTKRTDVDSLLGGKLESAGLPLKPPEWTLIHLGIALGAGLLLLLLSGGSIIASILGIVFGALIPWTYLDYKARKRRDRFLDGLPDTLQLLAGSLSAGYSLPQAVDAVVREAPDPIGPEFNRALVETRLGVPLEDALEGVGARMGSVDFAWVVMAIRIQREVGGNLAEILNTVAATLRERERLRRQVDVLSAEGRLSAWILGALPVLFVLYLAIARPDYLRVLYTEPLGWAMIIVGLTLFTAGVFWLRRAVRVEV